MRECIANVGLHLFIKNICVMRGTEKRYSSSGKSHKENFLYLPPNNKFNQLVMLCQLINDIIFKSFFKFQFSWLA